jgi:hypothetical protein
MILGALDKSGGERYFVEQASKNPAAFMTLIGKILPFQLSGEDGGPVMIGGGFAERLIQARERVSRLQSSDTTTEATSDGRT